MLCEQNSVTQPEENALTINIFLGLKLSPPYFAVTLHHQWILLIYTSVCMVSNSVVLLSHINMHFW